MAIITDRFTEFNTLAEYDSALTALPNVSKINSPRTVKYKPKIRRIWVDDFPPELIQEGEINVQAFINNPYMLGSNPYIPTNDTLVLNGHEYYLWRYDPDLGNDNQIHAVPYMVTDSNNYFDLYNDSLEKSGGAIVDFSHLYGTLSVDSTMYNPNSHDEYSDKLVKIELWQ